MPAAQGDNLQYIQIRDFKAGISDDPGANYPSGAAQRAGTFRCIANRTGALTPLPARTQPFSMPVDGTPAPDARYGLDGLYAPPISMLPTVLPFNPDFFPEHELMVGNEWLQGGNRHQILRRVRRFETPPTGMDTIKSVTGADASTVLSPNGMTFGTTRSNRAAPTTMAGVPVVICGWTFGNSFQYLSEFPDDQAPTINTPYDIYSNTLFILGIACHQGRVVAQLADSFGQGVNVDTFMGEDIVWSGINDVTTGNWTTQPAIFVPENPSGFAFLAPMSANELFAVKLYGGMYVTGPLPAAFVTSLPMVTGSEVSQRPAISNQGVWYGNGTSGVWMWAHGDTSQLMSPSLLPDFWLLDTPEGNEFDTFGGIRYQFARQDEWILVPNNWLYDQQLQSWWRLEDPSLIQIRNFTSVSRIIYGSESFYTNSYLTPIHQWERGIPTASYSWQSQPLWETIGNLTDIRQISVRAVGQGTVTVTLTGETSVSQPIQFQVDSTLPVLRRQQVRLQDANIAVKIESVGATTAPTVYECDLGYFGAQLETSLV